MLRVIMSITNMAREVRFEYFRRIKDLREDADLTQTDVAKLLGIQQTVYSRYERGFQTIPLEHLIRLADYYDVSLDYLTDRSKERQVNR